MQLAYGIAWNVRGIVGSRLKRVTYERLGYERQEAIVSVFSLHNVAPMLKLMLDPARRKLIDTIEYLFAKTFPFFFCKPIQSFTQNATGKKKE